MPKVLFVALHRPNRSPSQRFRYEQYTDFLKENGWEVETSFLIQEKWDKAFYSSRNYLLKFRVLLTSILKRLKDVRRASKYDVIYVQREAMMVGSAYFERQFSKSSAKLIFDFDDAIWLPNISDANQNLAWLKKSTKTAEIIGISDLVIAGNQYLAEYARRFNNRVVIFPTTIDTNRHLPAANKSKSPICIGWTGSKTTIRHFELAVPVLKRLKAKYGERISIKVIGDELYQNDDLDITSVAWSIEDEIEELQELDIGIMPLPNDDWSKGKCGLKSLQYMALKIPAVISPVGMNVDLIENGVNGYLAGNMEEWENSLSDLIEHEALRDRIAENARKTVEEHYSVESRKLEFLNYFNQLIQVG